MMEEFMGEGEEARSSRKVYFIISLILMIGLAAAWRWTPLNAYLSPDRILALSGYTYIVQNPAGPFIVLGVYVLGGLVMIPMTIMILWSVLIFGPLSGFSYALIGSLMSAGTSYGLGHILGRDTIRRFAGRRINIISKRLSDHGVAAVTIVRFIPVAPFTIVNMVIGASHIRFRDFLLGTFFGMVPVIFVITLLGNQIERVIQDPGIKSFLKLVALGAVIGVGIVYLRRRFLKRSV
jgi:phospholipase D1/2